MNAPSTATLEAAGVADILKALKRIGQLKGQGYLYGRPEDADATRERLAGLSMLTSEGSVEPEQAPEPEIPAPVRKAG